MNERVDYIMEPPTFDDQIFGDFSGPLSPLGPKPLNQSGHSIQVMLGMSQSSTSDLCTQRLPEVHNLLPGSPKIDHYKNMDYSNSKIDYSNKMGSYSPSNKYDYVNGKLDHYSSSPKMEYGKPMDYNSNGKMDYSSSPNKIDYEHSITMFQQPTQTMDSVNAMNGKKKEDGTTPTTTSSGSINTDATSSGTAKKNDKKKGDPNGAKKKKTR